jgi:hypothetical protein
MGEYDGEAELLKARLGLKFRCAICGKQHNPAKGEWRRCLQNVDIYQLFQSGDYDLSAWVPSVVQLRKGGVVAERVEKYYSVKLRIWDSEFELLTLPETVKERCKRALQLQRAFNKVFSEWCNKLPDIPLRVERIYESTSAIGLLSVNGKLWDAEEVLELFRCPTKDWDSPVPSFRDGFFWFTKYNLRAIDRELRCALVWRRDAAYRGFIKWGTPKKSKFYYYMVYRDRFVEVSRRQANMVASVYKNLEDFFKQLKEAE